MSNDTHTKSPNRLPLHTDWERYETPAVVRKHERQFLERLCTQMEGEVYPSAIERIARHYGARIDESADETLLFFDDADRAAACARRLREAGEALSISASLNVKRGGGMKVVDLQQRTPAWRAWRNAGVTASEAPILMGSPYKTPWRLWAEKRGLVLPEDLSGNPHVQRGIREEPLARRRFEDRHGVLLLPLCAESTEEPLLRASFDGLTDDGEPVELKAPTEDNFREAVAREGESLLYGRYYGQVQAQIFVTEADEGCLSLHCGEAFLDLTVPRDKGYIARLLEAARAFWECIQTGREPPLDPQRDLYVPSGADHEAWLRFAADYRQLDEKLAPTAAEIKAIEKKMAVIEQQFLTMMGEFTLAESSGVRISRYLKRGAIDYKSALLAMKPGVTESELEPFRRQGSEQARLTLRDEGDLRTEVPFEPEALKQAAGTDYWF